MAEMSLQVFHWNSCGHLPHLAGHPLASVIIVIFDHDTNHNIMMMIIEIILMKMIGNIWLINYNYDEYNYNDDQDAVDRVLGPICLEPLTLTSLLC